MISLPLQINMRYLSWIKSNFFFVFCVFLVVFIPLYPKLPLFDALPGYIVKVRIEDFLVLFAGLLWLREVKLKRIAWNTSYLWLVLAYLAAGVLSILLGVVLTRTIPLELLHIGKSGLILLRYGEYFTLFFFLFSAVTSKKQVGVVVTAIVLTLLGVVGYGIGQKYFRLPVYSTMNREYSKGETLFLDEGARPQSTFAGHYDLAVYLVIVLPLLFSLSLSAFAAKSKMGILTGSALLAAVGAGTYMLMLTQSKTSIAAYGVAILVVLGAHWLGIKSRRSRGIALGIFLVFALLGSIGAWFLAPASLKTKVSNLLGQGRSDRGAAPSDLVGDGYENKTISTVQPDGSIKYTVIRVKSTWSANALKYGLSMGIRLDTLWPDALQGFSRNPLTGSGYGTLGMLDTKLFQEADSTDNNYLRTLGETGILGFISFYGFVLFLLWQLLRDFKLRKHPLSIGLIGGTIGLGISAIYLDVFAASKVAFVFWATAGLVLKSRQLESGGKSEKQVRTSLRIVTGFLHMYWPLLAAVVLAFFLWHQNPFMLHNPTKDIEWNTSGLAEITSADCFLTKHTFSLCRAGNLFLGKPFNLYALLLVPFARLTENLGVFYYLNLLLLLVGLVLSNFVMRRFRPSSCWSGLLAAVSFAAVLRLTGVPWGSQLFLFVLVFFPLVAIGIGGILEHIKRQNLYRSISAVVVLLAVFICARSIVSGDLGKRFRPIAPNDAYTAVIEANGLIDSKPGKPSYLATVLNPYYIDQYAIGKYSSLPLSASQPYVNDKDKVWGIPKIQSLPEIYSSLLSSGANLYLSDFGLNHDPAFERDFVDLKQKFNLSYLHLGCEERCNLYRVSPGASLVSSDISTPYNGIVLRAQSLPLSYSFAVIPGRFDMNLGGMARRSEDFVKQLQQLPTKQLQFLVMTGDIGEKPEGVFTQKFVNGFALGTKLPILYSQGNMDLIAAKDVKGGYQDFFSDRDYFILMDTDQDSQLSEAQQMNFYNSLLKLEKLPRIKNLFIISHDLNWQDQRDPGNAIHVILRKLQDFGYIKTYILTSDHNTSADGQWYKLKEDSNRNITFAAGMVAGSQKDTYLQVKVDEDGRVSLEGHGISPY